MLSFSYHVRGHIYNNVSLVKTRLRASRRGEVSSFVGFRQPNPYENVRIFLECAIYQTHVIIGELPSTVGIRQPNPYENVRIFLECAIYQTHVIIEETCYDNQSTYCQKLAKFSTG